LCRDIFYIPEFVENNDVASLQEGFQTKIESAIATMAECQNINQHKIQDLQAKKERLLENIAQFRNEINARLDKLQDKTVSEIEEKMAALTRELNKKISNLEADIARMKSAQKKIGTASTNKSQAFVSTKIGLEVADKANYIGNEDKDLGHMEVPDFRGDQRILSLLKEIEDMGIMRPIYAQETDANNEINMADKSAPDKSNHPNADVTIANKETKESKENIVQSVSEHAEQSGQESTGGKKVLQFQIKGKKTVCTKVDSDCKKIDSQGIVSCCFMKNGKIVLCDYDNKKLKMLHRSTYEVTNQFDLPGLPWQLCAISDNSIAVSLGKLREIQYFSLQYNIQKSGSFSTDHNCYGLAYANDNLYVSDSDTYIYIYSEFGIKQKQVTNTLLKSPSFINSWLDISLKNLAVTDDGSRIFVTHPTNGLIMLDTEGKEVQQYNGIQLQHAYGCHYLSGNKGLLVCGMESNNILLFGSDGEIIQQVLRWDGGHDYKLVCCNQERTKMIVCRDGTYYIDIFDVKKDT
jgi:hypothetical protein